ncbi:MAG: 30S ribosomal protein S17 [Candidatus Nanohaloarchaeota archaeon QJJ-9]|nr:30S ribosomal protein S17 [Candidatus Nanohaloarchaeota archaeon QJJ-9]
MPETQDIGLDVEEPEGECKDDKCPFHGDLQVRGRTFEGNVESAKMDNTAVVTWEYANKLPKYERYERRNTKVSAHNPKCINAEKGDEVVIAECRPLSKTKKFVIVEKGDGK